MDPTASLALFARGKNEWNAWAAETVERGRAIVSAGEWAWAFDSRSDPYPTNKVTADYWNDAAAQFSYHQFVDPPGRHAADPGLLDHCDQRLLRTLAGFQERREIAALPQPAELLKHNVSGTVAVEMRLHDACGRRTLIPDICGWRSCPPGSPLK